RKIVVDTERVALGIAEVFAHRAARIRCDVLHGRGIGRCGGHDDRIRHGAVGFECLDHLRDGGTLLPDGDVDANYAAVLLIDDGVERDGGLTYLAVADDQLALAAADRNHGVDGFDAGLHWFAHRLPVHDAGRQTLDGVELLGLDGTLAVNRLAERVDHAAHHGFAHRNRHDAAGAANLVAFLDASELAQQHRADLIFFQVERDTGNAALEFDQLAGHDVLQAVNAGDTIAHRDHRAGFRDVHRTVVVVNFLAQQARDFICPYLSH